MRVTVKSGILVSLMRMLVEMLMTTVTLTMLMIFSWLTTEKVITKYKQERTISFR